MSQSSLDTVLADIRFRSPDERAKGRVFERLMVDFLRLDPLYAELYEAVWLWDDWPERWGMDCGIDAIALERHSGDYCAIQCKFYDSDAQLQKSDIDSFLSESGKSFQVSGVTKSFHKRLIISTTEHWNRNAERAIEAQTVPVSRLGLQNLQASPIDWSSLALSSDAALSLQQKKTPREHQTEAIADVLRNFQDHDRGKLIMACGTGKTFTALRLMEWMLKNGGKVLFLAPSISLIAQSLREWTAEATEPIHALVVCSDTKVGKDAEDMRLHDLAYPATTNAEKLFAAASKVHSVDRLVVFSTYQSIQVVSDAQSLGLGEFDLVICDEAHRTTGITLAKEDASNFTKVHDNAVIRAKKRLYMTATPRIYGAASKTKAQEKEAVLYSMDDEALYGPEFHRLGFGQAVKRDLLCDYKVMIVALEQQRMGALANSYNQAYRLDDTKAIDVDFATKVIGSWKGLSKQDLVQIDDDGDEETLSEDTRPMRRAVAFSRSIASSKQMTEVFSDLATLYQEQSSAQTLSPCSLQHVDGTMNALHRANKLDWLKSEDDSTGCRVLSNARCLSEGIDVPTLDGVVFFDTRESMVDIVQSVGRVMRKAEGKQYGYIILPVCIPAAEVSNYDNYIQSDKRFSGIWKVIKALRAHDESLVDDAEFRKKIRVVRDDPSGSGEKGDDGSSAQGVLDFPFLPIDQMSEAIYAAIPKKLGDLEYWSAWAKDVAEIAERMIARAHDIVDYPEARAEFDRFLADIRASLNPAITETETIEMLVQHSITKPIFEALFEDYSFTDQNPVSQSMQRMVQILEDFRLNSETQSGELDRFYSQVTDRVENAKSDKSRQEVIRNLYDTFFNTAFPDMAKRLGIVYTPICIVDFILHSVQQALLKHFHTDLDDHKVHVLDPFTGTGTFIVRLLQSGLISPEVLERKYRDQLHANEIVLLAYYIAAINIESSFHAHTHRYQPFKGMVLTDSFQMHEEYDWADTSETAFMYANNSRVANQKEMPIRVVIGNPPYSTGQDSANDDNQKNAYPMLDQSIRDSYAQESSATNKNSLYDSYIRALRLASNRIEDKGIVAFVTNGSFIDGNAADGLRKSLIKEFSHLYIFNLRGNQRTSGEESRREGGKVFGSGSRTQVAISLLIKDPEHHGDAELYYHDIGDYLKQQDKFTIIEQFGDISAVPWQRITPNVQGDWINQRDPAYDAFIPLGDKKDQKNKTIFSIYSNGVQTNRDHWAYNFSKSQVVSNMQRMTEIFNAEVKRYKQAFPVPSPENPAPENFVDKDSRQMKWSSSLYPRVKTGKTTIFDADRVVTCMYRPYCKEALYFDPVMNHRPYLMPRLFPTPKHENIIISLTGVGSSKPFSALAMHGLSDLETISKGQCFPLYWYEKVSDQAQPAQGSMFAPDPQQPDEQGYIRREAITDWALTTFQQHYNDNNIQKIDIFHYIYGLMHSGEYRQRFAANLKKMLPRLPFAANFHTFALAGKKLMDIHLNYETAEPCSLVKEEARHLFMEEEHYLVEKMRFAKKDKQDDKTIIVYNAHLSLSNIPLEAYQYQVNGKSAIEWLMERYCTQTYTDSGVNNNANLYSDNPRYIIDLIKRIVTVSLKTAKIVDSLPKLETAE